MGLDIVLGWRGQTEDERDAITSPKPPEGQFGYLRCSYAEENIFDWAEALLNGRGPYWIFGYAEDKLRPVDIDELDAGQPAFYPDWDACRRRIAEALDAAKSIQHNLFLVPLRAPHGRPEFCPALKELIGTP
jgi:hypothetical protein